LNQVSIYNGGLDSGGQTNCDQPCDWITTQFNGNVDGDYQVQVRNHNIYVTTPDGEQSMAQPQTYDPDYQAECARREQNYYAQQQGDCYDQPQVQAAPGLAVGLGVGFVGGLLLGLLGLGRRRDYGYNQYGYNQGGYNQEYENYNPSGTVVNQGYYNPVYNPTYNQSEYAQYNPSQYNNCNSYNASQNYYANQYYANLNNQGINPQYSSGDYPGTYYNQEG
jgi:hypothetical protein